MLTYEKQDPYHLLNNINSGSLTKRWQSAYELSNLMSDINKIPTDQLFVNQMIFNGSYFVGVSASRELIRLSEKMTKRNTIQTNFLEESLSILF